MQEGKGKKEPMSTLNKKKKLGNARASGLVKVEDQVQFTHVAKVTIQALHKMVDLGRDTSRATCG